MLHGFFWAAFNYSISCQEILCFREFKVTNKTIMLQDLLWNFDGYSTGQGIAQFHLTIRIST
jgi:hypothetical protein